MDMVSKSETGQASFGLAFKTVTWPENVAASLDLRAIGDTCKSEVGDARKTATTHNSCQNGCYLLSHLAGLAIVM